MTIKRQYSHLNQMICDSDHICDLAYLQLLYLCRSWKNHNSGRNGKIKKCSQHRIVHLCLRDNWHECFVCLRPNKILTACLHISYTLKVRGMGCICVTDIDDRQTRCKSHSSINILWEHCLSRWGEHCGYIYDHCSCFNAQAMASSM